MLFPVNEMTTNVAKERSDQNFMVSEVRMENALQVVAGEKIRAVGL